MLLACFALVIFAQVWLNSAWVLLSLGVMAFALGFIVRAAEDTPLERVATVIAIVAVPSALGMIAFGIWQSQTAIIAGRERTAALLILRGADMLQRDPAGKVPLELAVECGHAAVVRTIRAQCIKALGSTPETPAR